ncbi:MAG: Uma2 family endonuclease, partial [Acidobacteria bacterium]|nr:Uma2 family endonuclease [Acidobacteriota bacterium]
QRTERVDRLQKMDVYARAGVGHVWLVSPEHRFVEVYRLGDVGLYARIAGVAGEEPVRVEPFAAAPLEMARWWPEE